MHFYLGVFLSLVLSVPTLSAQAQAPDTPATTQRGWQAGIGLGNGLGVEDGYSGARMVALLRGRYVWRGPDQEEFRGRWFQHYNTRSRHLEAAALLGYPVRVGAGTVHAATGLALVGGRQLTDYRFTQVSSGFLSSSTHYFAYRRYLAVGLPLELSWQSRALSLEKRTLGASFQANLNPVRSTWSLLLTFTMGKAATPATTLL